MKNRDEFPALLNAMNLTGTGAEVGVKCGVFSQYLLFHSKLSMLLLIDPWRHLDGYVDSCNVSDETFEGYLHATKINVGCFEGRYRIMRMLSLEAAVLIADGTLDFVYLDADHSYAAVKADIAAWWPKVRKGGILAGHDYVQGLINNSEFGVIQAVSEFAKATGQKVEVTTDSFFPSWWTVK